MQPIPLLKDLHTCAWCENTAAFQTADRTERRNDLRQLTSTNTTIQKYEHVEITKSDVSI